MPSRVLLSAAFIFTSIFPSFGWRNGSPAPVARRTEKPAAAMPNLSGDAAKEFLEKDGSYDKLVRAVRDSKGAAQPENFSQARKIVASDGAPNDLFGRSLALSGNTAIVGAVSDDVGPNANQGSAYIFERNAGGADNWSEVKKLTASDGGANYGFGGSVAVNGNTVFVGSGDANLPDDRGAVYIFERNAGGADNWGQVKKLSPSDGVYFGSSVSIDQGTLVVGAEGVFDGETGVQGAAYIFERNLGGANNWGLVKRIQAELGDIGDYFGSSSCIKGNTVFIGTGRTRAYVFERDAGGIDNWGQIKELLSQQGDLDVAFAGSISLDGNTAVIGAPQDFEDENDDGQGAAYIYGRNAGGENNWGLIKRIIASDGAPVDFFGASVAVSGERILVGSFGDDVGPRTDQGSAYVFDRNAGGANNWGLVRKLVASDAAAFDRLGFTVALENKTALIGSTKFGPGPLGADAVYVFVQTNDSWIETTKPLPANCTVLDFFGFSVAVSGDTAVVGSPLNDVGANADQGAAYIFKRNTGGTNNWGLVKKVTASDGTSQDRLGWSVAIAGDTVIAGAFLDDLDRGSAYVFERNSGGPENWGEVKKLTASDGAPSDFFGRSVGISGNTIIIGALLGDVGSSIDRGVAYVFERNLGGANNWGQAKKLVAADGGAVDQFGVSVAVRGDTVVIGAFRDNIGANIDQGSVYVFERNNGGPGNWGELRKITASDGAAYAGFGNSVAISGNVMVVGASGDNVGTNSAQGSAYIFEQNTGGANNWGQVKKIVATDGAPDDRYGWSVAIDADTVVVGSVNDQIGAIALQGSAYVFKQNAGGANNWGQVKKIVSSDGAFDDRFGRSVAVSGDTAIVGVSGDDVGGAFGQGSARVFVSGGGTWNQQALLGPPPEASCGINDEYGSAVAISGDTAVIGAPYDDVGINTNQGSVYILERNAGGPDNWGTVALLTASDGGLNDFFGTSVATDGDTVIVGTPNDTIGANAIQGSVYIYERNTGGGGENWAQVKKLVIADGEQEDRFGTSVSISGSKVIAGAIYENNGSINQQGAAYIFEQNVGGANNWGQVKKLIAPDGAAQDWFGNAVAIDGDTVVVGAYFDDIATANEGSAYIFERNNGGNNNWGLVKKLTASDSADGDIFAYAVAIDGNKIVVGAHTDDIGANSLQGSAYIFDRNAGGANNWGQIRKLVAGDGAAEDFFGHSVGISGDTVIVGALYDDVDANSNQGSAYIFQQNTGGSDNWGQVRKLTAVDGSADDRFGIAVAVSGDDFFIGAYLANVPLLQGGKSLGGNTQGVSYVFKGRAIAPTAANVTVSGRIRTAGGNGIRNATVTLQNASTGETLSAASSSFGYYLFEGVPAGQTYILTVTSRRFEFAEPSRIINVDQELTEEDFTAMPQP